MKLSATLPPPGMDCKPARPEAGRADTSNPNWPDSPTLRFKDLLKLLSVSKSKAYELIKTDPDFPKGIPLYDSDQSPKFYWTHEAIAWVEGRANKFQTRQGGRK